MLPILPVSLGICPRPFKTRLRIRCFHYCHYSEKPGFNISGNSQTIRPSRPSQTISFVGTFPLPSSDETDWSQACTVKVHLRFMDTSLLRAVFFNVRNSYIPSKFNNQLNKGTVLIRTLFWGPLESLYINRVWMFMILLTHDVLPPPRYVKLTWLSVERFGISLTVRLSQFPLLVVSTDYYACPEIGIFIAVSYVYFPTTYF